MYVLSRNMKISEFLSENFQVLVVKFSVHLNKHVFVMQYFFVEKSISSGAMLLLHKNICCASLRQCQ